MKNLIAFLIFLVLPSLSIAESMYIDDKLLVPLRSGEGLGFRIVHKGVRSGNAVEILETNKSSGYSKVKAPNGAVGWLPTRYLVKEPIARQKLVVAEKQLATLRETERSLTEELAELKAENRLLKSDNSKYHSENSTLSKELSEITDISKNAIHLDNRNRELQEKTQLLQSELELLQADNQRLKDNKESDFILLGAGLVALGVFIALIVPVMKPSKKRDTWA